MCRARGKSVRNNRENSLNHYTDKRRDRDLARLGWRVLRLEAGLVVHRLPEAVARIRQALGARG